MDRSFMSHSVEDYARWRAVYDTDIARRDGIGLRKVGVYREANSSNDCLIIFDLDRTAAETREIFDQTMADPELQAVMQQGGVKAPAKAWIVDLDS